MTRSRTALIFATLLVLAGCEKAPSEKGRGVSDGPIKIGEFVALSGGTATFGQSSHSGTQMAIDEINANGGLLGRTLELIVVDTQSKPEDAATAVTQLISRDKVVALIGENSSGRTLAAAPIAQSRGVPLVSPSATNLAVTQKGNYIFRVCFVDPFQGGVLARFARNTLKAGRVAILKDVKNDYSVDLARAFSGPYGRAGGQIVAEESYSEGDTDFKAQLTTIKARHPDALFVPGYYTEVGGIASQARELGLTVPIFGGDGWDSPELGKLGGSAIEGAYYANHFAPEDTAARVKRFVSAYRKRFGTSPSVNAPLGYDAALLLADAIRRAGTTDGQAVRAALATTKAFQGVTGAITIDSLRNAVKPAVMVQMRDGRPVYVDTIRP